MTSTPLPPAIAAFIDATNAADTDAFLAAFTDDAVLSDWGRVYSGREEISEWNRTDNIGRRSHFDLVDIAPGPAAGTYVVTLTVSGDGYNGTGPMTITVSQGRISRLIIAPD
jgi:ketosteroid isomerase-like protein